MNNLSLVATETLEIISRGTYVSSSGRSVTLEGVRAAVEGTALYRPQDLKRLEAELPPLRENLRTAIEVTREKTGAAARRLTLEDQEARIVALNFASAKNPGGGFIGGARAQEEDLARCSALYACLVEQEEYYRANRAHGSPLYTDHLIYSPEVPFFRGEDLALLDQPFRTSIITSPAPNAGACAQREEGTAGVRETLLRRVKQVLLVARIYGHRRLVLGAWGCGAFRNDPEPVADAFRAHLDSPLFSGAFEKIVFAVFTSGRDAANYDVFQTRFA